MRCGSLRRRCRADHRRGAVADHREARPVIRMRGVAARPSARAAPAAARRPCRCRAAPVNRPEISRSVASIIVGHRPVAGDHHPAAGADEGADQPVQRDIRRRRSGPASAVAARLAPAGGVAGGEDDEVGVEPQVENLGEAQQAVRTRRRRSWSAAPAAPGIRAAAASPGRGWRNGGCDNRRGRRGP